MPQDKRQSLLSTIAMFQKLSPDEEVIGLDGVKAPAREHIGLMRGYLSKSLQYPDYPPMRTKNSGIDSTPIFQNLTDPSYSMATTIGRGNYTKDQYGNTHIIDTYDFPGRNPNTSLFSKIFTAVSDRRFSMGIPEAIAAHYSKDMPVDVQITHGATGGW